ncbi:aldo/keto reductase [Mycobacterium barrassiae]|uniref:aldo/keto reductase n=1 Tax=Mycobacterium barrassiae TaxID=319709 RepID=UPI002265822A|nr:aldo/keto reductase [Mycobacterium barrassiae]MCV7302828.1 aldo/keto reductase [Mycobacterium barrassiae]
MTLSAVGFGCGSLMQSPSRRERMAVLGAALDGGITHFDIARMYGLGMAEAELGRFLRTVERDTVTVATKFGIGVGRLTEHLARFQSPVRALLRKAPAFRRTVKQQYDADRTSRRYDATVAAESLDKSLTMLGLDYVDILLVHDPGPGDTVVTDELREFFERARREGKIRAWGVAQDRKNDADIAAAFEPEGVRQLRADLFTPPLRPADISFGVLNRSLARLSQTLRADSSLANRWRDILDIDPLDPSTLVRLILGSSATATNCRAVLYSSTNPRRVAAAARAVSVPLDHDVMVKFLALVQELRSDGAE